MAQIPAGSVGIVLSVSVAPFVIAATSTCSIQISGPGESASRSAAISSDSQHLTYTTTASDFTLPGRYEIRAAVTTTGGATYYGDPDVIYVTTFP